MLKSKVRLLRSGELAAADNVNAFIDKIRKGDKSLHCFLDLNEGAVRDAEAVDAKLREGRAGRLAGLAFAVKSNINVRGLRATCASRTLEDYYASFDAYVISRIKSEDGIIIGMANMDEFACGVSGESSAFGPTANPAAPGFIPGGSSSGSAAAVAAGFCDVALGSDTGGSIRNPASHCGVVGIKPSYGRVSRFGLIDLSMSLDQIGPLCSDVFGAALALEVISGQSRYDGVSVDAAVPSYSGLQPSVSKLRVGLSPDFERLCTDGRIYRLVADFARMFSSSTGSGLADVSLGYVDLAVQAYYPLVYVEFFSGTRRFDGTKYGRRIEESCGEEVLRRILGGREISKAEYHGAYYRKALAAKGIIADDFRRAFREVDVIFAPTTPVLPHRLGARIADPKVLYAYDAFTIPANLSGVCAGVVNIGRIDGVPVGLQVFAPAFREDLLVAVLAECEALYGKR
ncbi:Asp-tRNA(Asn)/Glu-tRNA(Gln) amidotransferase subunit GatA [Candidatus Woesearchaeota archaeon]|nr:Asp-tRNA(Asn)/Glu-tRNA(Gln) amidotransferase subunit GatA [Candidatus Woesearchaeota archaeon]